MNSNFHTRVSLALCFACLLALTPAPHARATTAITHDLLNRVTTLAESPHAARTFSYDPSGNRTNYSVTLGFSVTGFANQQIAQDTILSIPLVTTGALATSDAQWIVRSSNRQLVPKSGIQILGAGTPTPTAEITPASGVTGTTTLTLIANDGSVAAATSFTLTVGDNRPPRAIADSLEHPPGASARIEIRRLLSNDSDPDGDAIDLTALSVTSAHGGQVDFFGPFVRYIPPAGYDGLDLFHYTLNDSHGAVATGMVTVFTQAPVHDIPITVVAIEPLPENLRRIHFIGLWHTTYEIQASTDLIDWTPVGLSVSDERGRYTYDDPDAEVYPVRFYRAVPH